MRILKLNKWLFTAIVFFGLQQSVTAQSARTEIQQSELIPELLDLKTELTTKMKLGERYIIQIYSGDLKTASDILKEVRQKYEGLPADIVYETPNYKVWIGNFRNRLEADRTLLRIKKEYPSAFIPKLQAGL